MPWGSGYEPASGERVVVDVAFPVVFLVGILVGLVGVRSGGARLEPHRVDLGTMLGFVLHQVVQHPIR
jgi:hypothetical protein